MYCSELITEVKDYVGRSSGDNQLITDARILRWLNDAQRDIVKYCPGLLELDFKSSALYCISDQYRYSMSDITGDTTDNTAAEVAHVYYMQLIDGNNSYPMTFMPVDDFDGAYPDLTSDDYSRDKPCYWTRRGNYIEVNPIPDTDMSYVLKTYGTFYAKEFTGTESTEASELEDSDDGLVYYAVHKAYAAMGNTTKTLEWKSAYESWKADYKEDNDVMMEWDWNIYGD